MSSTTRTISLRRLGAVLAVSALVVAGQAMPAAAQTAPWGTWGHFSAVSQAPVTRGPLVVGDSLVWAANVQSMANHMTRTTGRASVVSAVVGGTWVTYADPAQTGGNHLLRDLSTVVKPGVTVIALGTNDARILTQHPGTYTPTMHLWIGTDTVNRVRTTSRCVLLVNVRVRPDVSQHLMSNAKVNAVNANLAAIAAQHADGRVRVANWNGYPD